MKGGSLALETMKTVVHKDDVMKHPYIKSRDKKE